MQGAAFTDLLFDQAVSVASDLEVILNFDIDADDCLTNGRRWLTLRAQDTSHAEVKLIVEEHFIVHLALKHSEEKVLCHLTVVHYLMMHSGAIIFTCLVASCALWLLLIKNDEHFRENETTRERRIVISHNLFEVAHVSLLREGHLSERVMLCQVLDERQRLSWAI